MKAFPGVREAVFAKPGAHKSFGVPAVAQEEFYCRQAAPPPTAGECQLCLRENHLRARCVLQVSRTAAERRGAREMVTPARETCPGTACVAVS